ncbi:helicase protein [Gemella bergeri ATCC 700627]|uniref:Helicase protein n=1 Tax=Gemella bergeri ATCC 700627 TaxID=1321820 RepID=U2QPH4_9BACL|nr:DEAD/DEAH box helicase [Gemella bergeri]ERK58391.1 helicase protein [Gemella bergeri ATCC 700627]
MKNTFIYNDHLNAKKVLSTLERELDGCSEFIFSVAFISESGLTGLLQILKNLEEKNIHGKILTTNYLYFNSPKVLDKLAKFKNIELKIFDVETNKIGFHTKGYLFKYDDGWRVLLGSANLTINALTTNKEWNTLIEDDNSLATEILTEFSNLWRNATDYTSILKKYKNQYLKYKIADKEKSSLKSKVVIPNKMQENFIRNFINIRKNNTRALLISATGTGKTYAAAFAIRNVKARRILFVVHREQIAKKALETFKSIFGNTKTYGLLSGTNKKLEVDFIFSTVQTLSKEEVLSGFSKKHFDEIIIDEVHRAGAKSYLRILDYFEPRFFLGMTASPDRTDGFNIYDLFDNNIVYEIRLQEALEQNLLCPFHYFGISDLIVNGKGLDDFTDFNKLVTDERVNHIINKISYYGYSGKRVKGLIFCSTKKEAKELSGKFNKKGYKTSYLTGDDSIKKREEEINKLVSDNGEILDYIFTVDIFNEGVDIPEVNQIVMLRPTQSAIVFVQQLGRGLRKAAFKDFVVIIDFIANYKNNFLIPVALSGDNSYDKDNIRRFLAQGTRYLPGTSTIHFDNISKQHIYKSIDSVKLNTWHLITDEYFSLKNKLGKIPAYYDFDNNFDIRKIFEVAGSYYTFLSKKEPEYKYKNKLTKTQENMLSFISKNLILSKKIEELQILKLLLTKTENIEHSLKKIMLNSYNKFIADYELEVSKKILTNNFVTSSVTKKRFSDCIFLNEKEKMLKISKEFKTELSSKIFKKLITELIDYGIYIYDEKYKNKLYNNTNFVLYEKYSFEDICKLFSWSINYVPLAIGGYKYDEQTKTLPVFINYDIDENSFNHDYTHGFLPDNRFTSMSKPRRNLNSKECEYFYNKDTKIYLFMRKNKDDKDSARVFYFLGEMKTIGSPKLVHRQKSKDTVIQFYYKTLTPIREDIYEYFTRDKV